MADVLYGADLGAVATDLAGNVKDETQLFTVYSDRQGANVFTLTRKVGANFTVGAGTAGVVTASSIGRILFYAQDTDATLWLKNGTNLWAVNPTSVADVVASRVAAALAGADAEHEVFDDRITALETKVNAPVTSTPARPWQMWRARLAAAKSTISGNYVSLNFTTTISTASVFSVNTNNDAVSVSVGGWYRLALRAGWSFNPTGVRSALILVNVGATSMDSATVPTSVAVEDDRAAVTGAATTAAASEDIFLTPGDSVLFVVRQTSGGLLDVNNGRHLTSASLEYLGAA